jgi:putative hydrolase of the HAD superfamily
MNVVFDLGAVLLTWEPVALVQNQLAPHAPTAEAAHALARKMFHHEDWLGFDRGTHSLDDAIGRMALRLALPADRLSEVLAPMGERLEPIPVTVELLASLRARRDAGEELRLYYLSNMPSPYARVLEYRHPFFHWFDGGIFSGDVQMIKPQREIYELLAAQYRLAAAETVFIDDSLANVLAARELGWQAIHCERPSALPGQLAGYLPVSSTLSTSKPSVRA